MKESYEKATLAGGCFWGLEKYAAEQLGVVSTRVGYTGGRVKNPGYEAVCTGLTGHAEALEITYDPSKTGYDELLAFFFRHHDPTTLNRQGPDIGSQYRSAIFYHTPERRAAAEKAIEVLNRSGLFKNRIVTEVRPAGEFYAAEAYHQQYLKKNPGGCCSIRPGSSKIGEVLKSGKG